MSALQNILPVIDVLPDAILLIDSKGGKIVEANRAFLDQTGFSRNELESTQLNRLPFFSRQARHGLLRLFIHAMRDREGENTFRFRYVTADKTLRDILAYAARVSFADDESYVLFSFRDAPKESFWPGEEDLESWKSCLKLGYEPYMEFRSITPLIPPLESEERISFLKLAGGLLRIRHANDAATELYAESDGSLVGRTFASFFNNGDDAYRFLDMLSAVGQMKAETTVATSGKQALHVEMNCMVRFEKDGSIAAVYCSQRDLSPYRRYEALLGGSRIEMDFTFNQPFAGLAFLTSPHPLERPAAENVEEHLDILLAQILIVRANEAMFAIHNTDKTRLLMKPMSELFPDPALARQVLKELFIMRGSSATVYDAEGKKLRHVSVFQGIFDDSDQLRGVMVASSKTEDNYQARHSNRKIPPETPRPIKSSETKTSAKFAATD